MSASLVRVFLLFLPVLSAATAVFAQGRGELENVPPEPGLRGGSPVWLGFLIIFILGAAVVAVSLLPSKRSHQPD